MGDPGLVAALRAQVDADRVAADAALSSRTTLRVGGAAAALVHVESVDELLAVGQISAERSVPWLVIGRGSNLLVADAGWPGIAIVLGRSFRGVDVDGTDVVAGAAEPMPVLAGVVARHGLEGLAFGVAIPGSVGGAIRMNAGAHGGQVADVLAWADVVRMRAGVVERWMARRLEFSYRHSALADDAVVTRAALHLRPADADELAEQMAEMRRWRRAHQPINEPSCGSVFRNPEGDSAGRLIEAAGLKGLRVGGAQVSARHANFITVDRDARAADVHAIIRTAMARVRDTAGVELVPEVVMRGFPSGEQPAEVAGPDRGGVP